MVAGGLAVAVGRAHAAVMYLVPEKLSQEPGIFVRVN